MFFTLVLRFVYKSKCKIGDGRGRRAGGGGQWAGLGVAYGWEGGEKRREGWVEGGAGGGGKGEGVVAERCGGGSKFGFYSSTLIILFFF